MKNTLSTGIAALTLAATTLMACSSDSSSSLTGGKTGGELVVTVSAESLGAEGYHFPPTAGQEVAFVDGWEVSFSRILVSIGNIRLSESPDKNAGNQAEIGPTFAQAQGPWALDLVKPGTDLDKGGAGKIATRLPVQFASDFDLEQRYAFSYDLVPASAQAQLIGLQASDPDYQEMIQKNLRVLLIGTATFKASTDSCKSSDANYDFSKLPTPVSFRFGLTGAESYINCQNPDNTGEALSGEESQRGIQLLENAPTIAQITLHTDHLFWSTIRHEALPMFNQFAAQAKMTGEQALVTLEDLRAVPLAPVTDSSGTPLPWRSCVSDSLYQMPTTPVQMVFDTQGRPLQTLYDFVSFNAKTMGHLNADGLCYVSQ